MEGTGDILRAKLPDWLRPRLAADTVAIDAAEQLVGGHSNETWRIEGSHTRQAQTDRFSLIVRWGDPDGVQAPYDIPGQFAMLAALADTDVPVPQPLWLEEDAAIIGTPFLTMRVVGGVTPNRCLRLNDPLRHGKRRAHAEMLARIHAVDWRAHGIGDLLPAPTPERCALEAIDMVRAWATQRGLEGERWFSHALAWLAERAPAHSEVGFLHGDPNLTNYRFDRTKIVAVLDWDAAKLSDPLWDVGAISGAMALYFADEPITVQERERRLFLDLYGEASGRALAGLAFWEPLFVLRAAVLTYHPTLLGMSAILQAKIREITAFGQ